MECRGSDGRGGGGGGGGEVFVCGNGVLSAVCLCEMEC